ncbi:MAG: hypothetical protein ACOX52_18140 [Verrucomicrobiota bacterium]
MDVFHSMIPGKTILSIDSDTDTDPDPEGGIAARGKVKGKLGRREERKVRKERFTCGG